MLTTGKTHKPGYQRLTSRQIDVVQAIRKLMAQHGMSPSIREIGDEIGVGIHTALFLVRKLEEKGFATRTRGKYRSLRLTAASEEVHPERTRRANAQREVA